MTPGDFETAEKPVRVFLSWSGETSKLVAKALHDGMELLSPRLEPWLSEDLEPGAEWASTLVPQIRRARLAVLCLTRRNVSAAWIAFETGAYYSSSRLRKAVVPFLLDIPPAELTFPLALFQSVSADWTGLKMLFTRIGELVGIDASTVEEQFAKSIWPQLNDQLTTIRKLQAEAEVAAHGGPTNIANAFYLGHDLRWTMDVLDSGAAVKDVKHGLIQILHQAKELGFGDNNNFLILRQKATDVLKLPDKAWTEAVRDDVALALHLAFDRLGTLVIGLQPGYRPYDPDNREQWLAIQADNRA
jgi:hypothetical protein